jgi:hypothetical protein
MLKIPAEYERDTSPTKLMNIFRQVSPCLVLDVFAGIYKSALVDDSGMMRTQMGTHNRLKSGLIAWDALYDTSP